MLLGVNLSLLIGPSVPLPAPLDIAEAVQSVSVTHNDDGRSGFQIVMQIGRAGPTDLLDYRLLLNPLLRPFNRVILVVVFGGQPRVLMDGLITNQQFVPANQPGAATLTLTGEDLSIAMDLEKKRAGHLAMDEMTIARRIIGSYAQYRLIPMVMRPPTIKQPSPSDPTPVQQRSDLEHLREMGKRFGHVFYVEPGRIPGTNVAYWGPPKRDGQQQRALTVNQGPETNVDSISFAYDALAPTIVKDAVQYGKKAVQVMTRTGMRLPPLVANPAPTMRTSLLDQSSGLEPPEASARAQGITDRSTDSTVTAEGELDALRYGDLLKARGTVGLRGAGQTYDGLYYVKSVSHAISKGQYKQRFSLAREGTGALTAVVVP